MALGSLLLLCSALLHAAWNALAKKSADKEALLLGMTVLSALFTLVLLVISHDKIPLLSGRAWIFALLSGVFEGLYLGGLSRALRGGSLGQSYAIMRGGAMALVWILSISFFHEIPKQLHGVGAIFVFLGMMVLNYSGKEKAEKGGVNIWAYLSAIFIAGYHLCYHQALVLDSDPQVLFFISMLMSVPCLWLGMGEGTASRIRQIWNQQKGVVLTTAAFSTASFLIFLYGLRVAAPGYAISLRNSSIFFALVFSYFMRESLTRVQILGAVIIGCGTILLSL